MMNGNSRDRSHAIPVSIGQNIVYVVSLAEVSYHSQQVSDG